MKQEWDRYWVAQQQGAALTNTAVGVEVLQQGWRAFFTALRDQPSPRLLDIASGGGEVARVGREVLGSAAHITAIDYSTQAVQVLGADPAIDQAIVADAAALPLADASATVVVSQFGVEYAGSEAFVHAARVLAPAGALRIVAHRAEGPIQRECEQNRQLAGRLLEIGVLDKALVAFEMLGEVQQGKRGMAALRPALEAVNRVAPAFRDAVMAAPSTAPARQFAERLFGDLSHTLGRITAFDAGELRSWVQAMRDEMQAYEARMAAMVAAALSVQAVRDVVARMQAQGLEMAPPAPLQQGDEAFAWELSGTRPAGPTGEG